MVARNKGGALTDEEKRIVKALLAEGRRNQDIQALLNIGRDATVNSGRITEVKKDDSIVAASDNDVGRFRIRKDSYDPKTGLNLFDHERLIRAREAMTLAVQVFNSPTLRFKTEVFTMLTNVAWTYLMHEYYERKKVKIVRSNGQTLSLSELISRQDCPLSKGVKDNLCSLKKLRDEVEHKLLGPSDAKWLGLFQACCLNFDKAICDLFGPCLTLSHDLSFAIQFTKMNLGHLATLNHYEIPAHIEAIDARLTEGMTEAQTADLEYRFRVVYTLDSVTKSRANFQFIRPNSAEGKDIHNVLVKHLPSAQLYPHKPGKVVELVRKKSRKSFTLHNHMQAWKKFKARPLSGALQPDNTNRDFCIYLATHKDYTYSDQWVKHLIAEVSDDQKFADLKAFALK